MDCRERGSVEATEVEVTFTDGAEREIPLCEDCREAYDDGDLVQEVENE